MGAIKATVGIAADVAGWVITFVMFPVPALGTFAAVMLGPSDMAHADASTDKFLLGAISAVMLLGMLIAGCFAFVSQRHSASYQQGNDYATEQAYPGMLGPNQVECGIAMPHAAHDIGGNTSTTLTIFKHGCVDAPHTMEYRG
jgi:hypothetical protein